jgi:tripartite-type tricarboxylate transporter receptor subunit TctC
MIAMDTRLRWLPLSLGLVLCTVLGGAAHAEDVYPTQPVRVIVPFPPGAGVDIVARLVAEKLTLATGKSFIIENHSGAAGNIGAAYAARATPDGYTRPDRVVM